MKKTLFLTVFLFVAKIILAQIPMEKQASLYLKIENSAHQPVKYCDVWLIEKETGQKYEGRTGKTGRVDFFVVRGNNYSINFNEHLSYSHVEIPATGMPYVTKKIIFDPPADYATTDLKTDTVVQNVKYNHRPNMNEVLIKMKVTGINKRPQKNVKVQLYCQKLNKLYIATTDGSGEAYLLVPPGNKYVSGVGIFSRYDEFQLPDRGGIMMGQQLDYTIAEIKENNQNDTITQELPPKVKPTLDRVHVHVKIVNLDGNPLDDEDVFFAQKNSDTVYHARTGSNGIVDFLLPKGVKYVLNLKYERDIDLFDYPMRASMHTTEVEYGYIGSQVIEDFYANSTDARDENGFLLNFLESKIEPLPFKRSMFEKTENGYQYNFEKKSPTSPPAFAEGRIYMGSGYYGTEFYCFDAETGQFRWGRKLADNGPSAVVYHEGIVLIITESCTLYAIDAISGNLKWSKWLNLFMYSTPTVADGKVFTAYPDNVVEMVNKTGGIYNNFVLAAFDLHTGEPVWQKRISNDILSSPVVSGNEVFVTTIDGKIYNFNQKDGQLNADKKIQAVTAPTIYNNKVYVSTKDKAGNQQLTILNSHDLSVVKNVSQISGMSFFDNPRDMITSRLLSYNGSRALNYKGKNYMVMGGKLVCSKPETGQIIWSHLIKEEKPELNLPVATMPLVSGGKILISTFDGRFILFDPNTGKVLDELKTDNHFHNQPIVHNGWIYSGNEEGTMIAIDTQKATLYNGWKMWNFNGAHNTVIK